MRRTSREPIEEAVLSNVGVTLNRDSRQTTRTGEPLELTAREFDLLALLLANARRVLSRDVILQRVWCDDFDGDTHVVDVYVHYLRRKLGPPNIIQAVRGVGFVLR